MSEAVTEPAIRGVTFDAMGTLVTLDHPVQRLVTALASRGLEVSEPQAARALRAEITYYRAHHDEGLDARSLAALRARCAGVLSVALPPHRLADSVVVDALVEALVFMALPGATEVLEALADRQIPVAVVSNWDISLSTVLHDLELDRTLRVVVTSAEAGAAKPDPAIFAAALAALGVSPEAVLHVGDSVEHDAQGARAAGLRCALVGQSADPERGDDGPGLERTFEPLASLDDLLGLITAAPNPGPA